MADYDKNFATFTLKRFMDEYVSKPTPTLASSVQPRPPPLKLAPALTEIARIKSSFSILSIKVLLVSLLNAFRDLTLLGVRSFDFNHMNNVLVSQDFQSVRLIDIDGGSISTAYGVEAGRGGGRCP